MIKYKDWTGDGIFQCNPDTLYQLCTSHILVRNTNIPHLFILLQGNLEKLAAEFIIQFYMVKNLLPTLEPESLMTDFEKGSITGFLKIYLNTKGSTSIDKIWPLYTGAGLIWDTEHWVMYSEESFIALPGKRGHSRHSRWCVLP